MHKANIQKKIILSVNRLSLRGGIHGILISFYNFILLFFKSVEGTVVRKTGLYNKSRNI